MRLVLEAFSEKEREYIQRARTKAVSLEDTDFKMKFPGFTIVGTPDRIDEHPDGFFILDYKTSSVVPHGTDMIELGYRLQLPFYALATQKETGKPVLGVQFVVLDRKASRGSGVFFKSYNGKEAGKLTTTTARSKSLLSLEPGEAWSRFEDHLVKHAAQYVQGHFEARPKKGEQECASCRLGDLCGLRRKSEGPHE